MDFCIIEKLSCENREFFKISNYIAQGIRHIFQSSVRKLYSLETKPENENS